MKLSNPLKINFDKTRWSLDSQEMFSLHRSLDNIFTVLYKNLVFQCYIEVGREKYFQYIHRVLRPFLELCIDFTIGDLIIFNREGGGNTSYGCDATEKVYSHLWLILHRRIRTRTQITVLCRNFPLVRIWTLIP